MTAKYYYRLKGTRSDNKRGEAKRLLISVNKTAQQLGVSKKTIYRMLTDGRLKSCRVGSLHRIDTADIDKMLHKQS